MAKMRVLSPAEAALVRRIRRAAASFRRANQLTKAPWEASSYPLATNIDGQPDVKTLVWYPGPGCAWSEAGGCLMCNFGWSSTEGGPSAIELFVDHLRQLDRGTRHLHLGPGGSFYDDRETSPAMRQEVLHVLSELRALRTLGIETRPNLVTYDLLMDTVEQLPHSVTRLVLGFGLECWNDFLREIAVNKGYSRQSVVKAGEIVAKANANQRRVDIEFETYILLKPVLLTEREAVDEALRTVDWSLRVGAGSCAIFMNTIKDATVQGFLAQRDDLRSPLRYQTAYLRSAVEVLHRLPSSARRRTVVLGLQSGIMATEGPRGCERCAPFLLGAIYAHSFDRAEHVIRRAASSWCPCRDAWEQEMTHVELTTLQERARALIRTLEEGGFV